MSTKRPGRKPGATPARPNSLNLDRARLMPLLDSMDFSWANAQAERDLRRGFVRWPFRRETIELTLTHIGGTRSTLRVACRNISRTGMSVLHSTFVHPGTACTAVIPHPTQGAIPVPGKVARCDHRSGIIHEVGVRFDQEIDVRCFLSPHDPFSDFFSMERVEPRQLSGRVVFIDPDPAGQKSVAHVLRESRITLRSAGTAREGLAMIDEGCDLVLCDLRPADETGLALVAAAQSRGHRTPSIVLTPVKDAALRRAVGDLRVDAFLLKPPDPAVLLRAMGEYLIVRRGRHTSQGALNADTVEGTVELMAHAAADLETAVGRSDLPAVRALCDRIAGSGRAGAFASARLLAMDAAHALASTERLRDAVSQLKALVRACREAPKPYAPPCRTRRT